jgi:hypothetical protein
MSSSESPGRTGRSLALFLLGTAVFAAVCWQAPLYYSNQNQYFLHGLAHAGVGLLHEDWLANTLDPTPLFSALVTFTVRYLSPWVFHLDYALIQGVYAAALFGLFVVVAGDWARRRWLVFVALFVLVHAALLRWASYRWLNQDYPWFFQSGLAGQYVLGAMFQPSTFGVFLIVSVWLFVFQRVYLAVVCAVLAATIHSTYLLPAAMLVLGFQVALLVDGQPRRALAAGALALVLVLPVVVYVLRTFGPTSPEQFAQAQEIVADFRIPHHARIDRWLDPVAGLQIAWVVLSIVLARPRSLRIVLGVATLAALALTLVQAMTGSNTLALMFPWRISAVLVPIATAVNLARLATALPAFVERTAVKAVCIAVLVICVAGGVCIGIGRQGFRTSDDELPLFDFVSRKKVPGDTYFIPVTVPDPAKVTRGSLSSDFKPLAEKQQGVQVIAYDLQRFRLHTGAPLFVDFKSIPYKDTEVLEWRSRIQLAQEVQALLKEGKAADAVARLREHGVTHVILPATQELAGVAVEPGSEGLAYHVYRIRPVETQPGSE